MFANNIAIFIPGLCLYKLLVVTNDFGLELKLEVVLNTKITQFPFSKTHLCKLVSAKNCQYLRGIKVIRLLGYKGYGNLLTLKN
jgi:hypothetical protein